MNFLYNCIAVYWITCEGIFVNKYIPCWCKWLFVFWAHCQWLVTHDCWHFLFDCLIICLWPAGQLNCTWLVNLVGLVGCTDFIPLVEVIWQLDHFELDTSIGLDDHLWLVDNDDCIECIWLEVCAFLDSCDSCIYCKIKKHTTLNGPTYTLPWI